MKKTIIIAFLSLFAMAGQAQIKCHIEGELRDTTQGKTVIVSPVTDGPSLLELNQENHVWEKSGAGQAGGAMFLIDRDGTILSTSTDAEELEPLIMKALNIE